MWIWGHMIYIVCHSGYLNFGDEFIAKTWIDFLSKKFPLEDIWIDTCDPGVASVLHRKYKNIKFTDTLWSASRKSIGKNIDYLINFEFEKDSGLELKNGIDVIKGARCVHIVGGGYLNSELYFNYAILAILKKLKENSKFSIIGTGLGLDPIDKKHEFFIREYLKCFSWIDVRDRNSYEKLIKWGFEHKSSFSCDDVFLNMMDSVDSDRPGRLVISAQEGDNKLLVVSFIMKLIEKCPQAKNGIDFLLFDANNDCKIVDLLYNLTNNNELKVLNFNEIWNGGLKINENDFVFSTRFHAHLIASMMGAHGLCASVSIPYYDFKHISLIDAGSGFDIIGMHDFDFKYDWFSKKETFRDHAPRFHAMKLDIVDKAYGFMIEG